MYPAIIFKVILPRPQKHTLQFSINQTLLDLISYIKIVLSSNKFIIKVCFIVRILITYHEEIPKECFVPGYPSGWLHEGLVWLADILTGPQQAIDGLLAWLVGNGGCGRFRVAWPHAELEPARLTSR
jgi:hypothetical protein